MDAELRYRGRIITNEQGVQIADAGSIAAAFGLVTDYVVRTRFAFLLPKRRKIMKEHVIICGFGKLGSRKTRSTP